jgi:hypothetical protein
VVEGSRILERFAACSDDDRDPDQIRYCARGDMENWINEQLSGQTFENLRAQYSTQPAFLIDLLWARLPASLASNQEGGEKGGLVDGDRDCGEDLTSVAADIAQLVVAGRKR